MDVPEAILESLPSPCLVVDVAAVDRNIARATQLVEGTDIHLRPHFKAHKSTTLMLRQLAAGSCVGVTVQTSWEGLALARAGVPDILVAAPVVDPASLAEISEMVHLGELITVVVDDMAHLPLLESAARAVDGTIGAFIELDVGSGRCGIPLGDPKLVAIARAIEDSDRLRLRGLQAYEGFAVLREDAAVRDTLVGQVAAHIHAEVDRLQSAGHSVGVISGAGTGTAHASVKRRVHDELQIGSYVLMDSSYQAIGVPFEPAIACVARCVSRRDPAAAVLNAGLKALAVDHGLPRPAHPGLRTLSVSDEHTRVAVSDGIQLRVGDAVLIVPAHLDPTVNLHDTLFAWDAAAGRVDLWPVDARLASGSRYGA